MFGNRHRPKQGSEHLKGRTSSILRGIDVRLAYIITAHKLPVLLIRLVHRLQSGNATFLIHVDKKTPRIVYEQMKEGLGAFDNVHFLDRRRCYYLHFGCVEATLEGIRALLSRGTPFDFAILLTGQDYPLKTNAHIEAFFQANKDTSFMAYGTLPRSFWGADGGMLKIDRWYLNRSILGKHPCLPTISGQGNLQTVKRLVNFAFPWKRHFLPGMRPYGGSAYWNLTDEAVHHVAGYVKSHPEFVRFFRSTEGPDEMFFQTLLLNSSFKDSVVNDDLRFIDWSSSRRQGSSPALLRESDFDVLRDSPKLFARKFDPTVDGRILDMIDEHILLR
jgi:hypothetical protein